MPVYRRATSISYTRGADADRQEGRFHVERVNEKSQFATIKTIKTIKDIKFQTPFDWKMTLALPAHKTLPAAPGHRF